MRVVAVKPAHAKSVRPFGLWGVDGAAPHPALAGERASRGARTGAQSFSHDGRVCRSAGGSALRAQVGSWRLTDRACPSSSARRSL